jgi:anti-sigma-K factor RskA
MHLMGDVGHDDLDELLGAYALDAVDVDEARRVEEYLASNPRAAAEVQQHREVATMLAFTGADAPAELWQRIEQAIDGPAPAPGPELARVLSIDDATSRRPQRSLARRAAPWLAAAAAVVVAVAGTAVIVGGDGSSETPLSAAFEQAVADRDSQLTTLVSATEGSPTAEGVIDPDGNGFLEASTLPPLGADQTYQLWGVMADSGDVISLGILGPNPELETFTVEGSVAALAVTIETSPGVISDGNPEGAFVGEF